MVPNAFYLSVLMSLPTLMFWVLVEHIICFPPIECDMETDLVSVILL